jgi:ABC-type nitrate/sulfonate/bicarbonate transport system permease component
MLFGEAWAATQGLGFMIIVANATGQSAKAIAGLILIAAVMAGLSFTLRWILKTFYSAVETPQFLVG